MEALRRLLAAWRNVSELDTPKRITTDVVIKFRGRGPARFRVQHARDAGGMPDDLSWCDVSVMSNRNATDPNAILFDGDQKGVFAVRGVLVDKVDGDVDAFYRRHTAGWLRVIPLDDIDAEARKQCQAYTISIQPVT